MRKVRIFTVMLAVLAFSFMNVNAQTGQIGQAGDSLNTSGKVMAINISGTDIAKNDNVTIWRGAWIQALTPRDTSLAFRITFNNDSLDYKMDSMRVWRTRDTTAAGVAFDPLNIYPWEVGIRTDGTSATTDTVLLYGYSRRGGRWLANQSESIVVATALDTLTMSSFYWAKIDSVRHKYNSAVKASYDSLGVIVRPAWAIKTAGAADIVIGIAATAIPDSGVGLVIIDGILVEATVDGGSEKDTTGILTPGAVLEPVGSGDWAAVSYSGTAADTAWTIIRGMAILIETCTNDNTVVRIFKIK